MLDQDRISPYKIKIQYLADKWWKWRGKSIKGLSADPTPNSPNLYYMNCMTDSKENYL